MKNFIIFFNGKEGTSALVRLLDNFPRVSIVHQVGNRGWEPFDSHNCGPMRLDDLFTCLDSVLGRGNLPLDRLNGIYTRTAGRALERFDRGGAVGFKMRFQGPTARWRRRLARAARTLARPAADSPLGQRLLWGDSRVRFKERMLDFLQRNDVAVFIMVRQDIFRWALSKYHGDGSGRTGHGHLQFKLAAGEISRKDLGRIQIDLDRLGAIIEECERTHAAKRRLMDDLAASGIRAVPLLYEDFLQDKVPFLRRFGDAIGLPFAEAEIEQALAQGAHFEKVHSTDISHFVANHAEVLERFGGRFVSWRPQPAAEPWAVVPVIAAPAETVQPAVVTAHAAS